MRILIVTINSSKLNFNPAILKDFADKEEIDIRDGLESGKEFIINYLVNQKKHVDFIIISRESSSYFYEWNQNDEEANIDTFAIWLRKLNECYSSDNFQIKSIPLILNDCETYHKSISILSFQNLYYDLILDINSIHPDYILYHLGRPINNWINKLGDELDNLDLDTSFNFEKSIIKKKDSHDLKILSKNFIDRCQKLNYVWIGDNINKLYINVDKLKEMFKISILNPNLRNEKEYHRFFLSNKGILLRDQYYETIYENQFYHLGSRKYEEPDFINLSHEYSFNNPEVFEVKLPNQRLYKVKKEQLSKYFINSIYQAGTKYYNYFQNVENTEQITDGLSYTPKQFDYTLLIGRDGEKEENQELLKNYILPKNLSLNIITYDDLLYKYQKVYNRIKRFSLK